MAINSLSYLTILGLLVASSSLFGVSAEWGGRKALAPAAAPVPADIGFTPLDSKDPKVLDIVKFAVDEHNKASNDKLVLDAVLEAISVTNEGGTNFELVILANSGKDLHTYYGDVLVAQNVKKLTSFKQGQDQI